MNLKEIIDKIFDDNTDYSNPSQAVNQASSLNSLSSDLYTDSKRFIYELLQNADDSSRNNEEVMVWIKIIGEDLIIAHSGEAFTSRDIHGICNINHGTKKSDLTKTGYKGIGFKSVFGQSDLVTIFTNNEYFRFDYSYPFEWKWGDSKDLWEKDTGRLFQYPWQIIPIYTDASKISKSVKDYIESIDANVATIVKIKHDVETKEAVKNLSENVNMFLFLKNISELNFETSDLRAIKITRNENNVINVTVGDNFHKWLMKTINLSVPSEVKIALQNERNIPEKLLNADIIELTLGAKLNNDGFGKLAKHEKLIYSYLPTDEVKYSFPVLVNSSFLTTSNRESLHADSKWNQWLFYEVALEIFKWISELVKTPFSYQAYNLIPSKAHPDELGKQFNEGIKVALDQIPFVVSKEGALNKVKNSIVDFTYLSEKSFVGQESIKNFVVGKSRNLSDGDIHFVKHTPFFRKFKGLGAMSFEWEDIKVFLQSPYFVNSHTLSSNIELIKHFKKLSESDKKTSITLEMLRKLPFIWDHKNNINYPLCVCFPTADDKNWDNPNSELCFLHDELQTWLQKDMESRQWLESIGVIEKTDITYITQNILPNIENYVTHDNAIRTIRDLFNIYSNGSLKKEILIQLSRIKLLTQKGALCSAEGIFMSDYYNPRMRIEKLLEEDIFVNEDYCTNNHEKEEWKQFFKTLGVKEGTSIESYQSKVGKLTLINDGFHSDYFNTSDKKFNPFCTIFTADEFINITTLKHIKYIKQNPTYAFEVWNDFIENYSPNEVKKPAIGFWGHNSRPGRTSGNEVENYMPWYVRHAKCIPTLMGTCETSNSVFLNTEEIKSISGKYLPVFNGAELSADWRAFFEFRTKIELNDYLTILSKISEDTDDNRIRKNNYNRIQSIYSILLEHCVNWSEKELTLIKEWSITRSLLNTKDEFSKCTELKYFLDGNEIIFQDQYLFLILNAENKRNKNIEFFLNCFNVGILRQNEFDIVHSNVEICQSLEDKLNMIAPYISLWINSDLENNTDGIEPNLLIEKIEKLTIFEADELKITYDEIDFYKQVNTHFDDNNLYVTKPWTSNLVLLKLSEILCRYLNLIGHDKKIDFMLRATEYEIQSYFAQESIDIPESIFKEHKLSIKEETSIQVRSIADLETVVNQKIASPKFFHLSKSDYSSLLYIKPLITRAVNNVIEHLKTLPDYDCSYVYPIAESVVSGITKNGNEITIVARPSDNDEVLIYYTSEFDVLEYVDAELWCEDGIDIPRQITLGELLKKTGINRIPVTRNQIEELDLQPLINTPKSEKFDFNAVPYVPQRIAETISAFANSNGGTILFGVKENGQVSNEAIGLSNDFQMMKIVKKAISSLSPIPEVAFDWIMNGDKKLFAIKTEKSANEVKLDSKMYIRKETTNVLVQDKPIVKRELNLPKYDRTIAIIISIENYFPREKSQIPNVLHANNDAIRFKETLIKSMNVEEGDIHMFLNEEALKSNLEYELKGLFHSLTEEVRLIFYYVGHGFHNGITNYLSTYDMHKSNISNTAVSLQRILLDPLKKSKCNNALIFIDACAKSFQDTNERSLISDLDDEELKIFSDKFPCYSIFLSCQPGQSSYSCNSLKNGIWTHHLVEAIGGRVTGILHNNRYLTDRLLNDYLSKNVAAYVESELDYIQNPKAILESSRENIILDVSDNIEDKLVKRVEYDYSKDFKIV